MLYILLLLWILILGLMKINMPLSFIFVKQLNQ